MKTTPAILGQTFLFKTKIPIAKPHLAIPAQLSAEITKVLASGVLTNGPHTAALEANVAKHLRAKHAIAVSSATAGLMLTFRALELCGDVVVPSFTFMATAGALVWCGLRPVFADIELHTANLDPAQAEATITKNTTAIVAVHNSGNPADIEQLVSLAKRHSVRLVFDAAHAFGSLYQGIPVGQQGDAQVFSLTPTKLVTGGEGGIVVTDDDQVAERVRVGRNYGNRGDYNSDFAGLSARLPELNALIADHSFHGLEEAAQHRNRIAMLYRERLGKLPGVDFQKVRAGDRSSFKDFSIAIDANNFGLSRDQLAAALSAENIETRTYYDPPVHRQKAYQSYAPRDNRLPNTGLLSQTILNLPIWSDMPETIVDRVCQAVERAHATGDVTRAPQTISI